MTELNYIDKLPVVCKKCGEEYRPGLYKNDCPHDVAPPLREREAIKRLVDKGMSQLEAEEFLAGVKRGVKEYQEGNFVAWSEVKKKLGLN